MNPITVALAGLLAYRTYHGQGRLAEFLGRTPPEGVSSDTPNAAPGAPPGTPSTGNILDDLGRLLGGGGTGNIGTTLSNGLNDLINRFQQAGHGALAQSWVSAGQNQPVAPAELERALGPERIEWLQQRTGLSRTELLEGLSRELPKTVDQLTPEGRVPEPQEAAQMVRA